MREIVHVQAGQCGNQIGSTVKIDIRIGFHFSDIKIVLGDLLIIHSWKNKFKKSKIYCTVYKKL